MVAYYLCRICLWHLLKWDPSYEDVFPAQLKQAGTQTTGSREELEKRKRRVTFPPICLHTCWCFRAVTLKENSTAWARLNDLSLVPTRTRSPLSLSLCCSECVRSVAGSLPFLKDMFLLAFFSWQILSDITVYYVSIVKRGIERAICKIGWCCLVPNISTK